MGWMAYALALALTGTVIARQQNSPPAGTPSAVSQERTWERQTAREQAAQSSEELTTPDVQQIIHDGLSSEPALAGTSVSVQTDDRAIVLMGSVDSEKQHEAALRIAQSFTGGRQIVDKIKIRGTTSE
jgi:BON domain